MTPAQISLALFEQRRTWLLRQPGADHATIDAKLRPWAAIALRAGADPAAIAPDVALAVEDYRRANLSDSAARACAADDLCPREQALAVLARARDAAIDSLDPPGAGAQKVDGKVEVSLRHLTQAEHLAHLAAYLGAPAYRCPSLERKAA